MSELGPLTESGWIRSEHYQETMENVVQPRLASCREDTVLPGYREQPLFCSCFSAPKPRGTVVVLHGFTECADKFSEVIHGFLTAGYSVLAYDQRGHGRSWRKEGIDDLSLTHVDHFSDYVRDLEIVCEKLLKKLPKPWFIFAHSMGGAVTALFLEQHPDVFQKAVLCAPMIAPNRGGIPFVMSEIILGGAKLLGKGKKRIFTSKPYAGPENFDTSCASGRARFDWFDAVKAAKAQFHNNGPTYNWTFGSVNVTRKILRPGAVERIACPVRLYAAQEDNSVLPEAQKKFIARVRTGERIEVPGSRHEIYRSGDDVVFPWWEDVLKFLNA